ncbi:unnamed protein product [Clonostachys chloroleuca]|uniref:Uncharacterized protein n=1 Tax=Clonostachys chloroleuca TaxID=1926264 RepID=A0AA35PXI5_9HYPO|nr:unnamed protein product [Clonostachys chloroleuca]
MSLPVSVDGILFATGLEAGDTITRDAKLLRLAPVQLAATGRSVNPKADGTGAVLHAQINTLAEDTYIPRLAANALAAAVVQISPMIISGEPTVRGTQALSTQTLLAAGAFASIAPLTGSTRSLAATAKLVIVTDVEGPAVILDTELARLAALSVAPPGVEANIWTAAVTHDPRTRLVGLYRQREGSQG